MAALHFLAFFQQFGIQAQAGIDQEDAVADAAELHRAHVARLDRGEQVGQRRVGVGRQAVLATEEVEGATRQRTERNRCAQSACTTVLSVPSPPAATITPPSLRPAPPPVPPARAARPASVAGGHASAECRAAALRSLAGEFIRPATAAAGPRIDDQMQRRRARVDRRPGRLHGLHHARPAVRSSAHDAAERVALCP